MREEGIRGRNKRKWTRTTDSKHGNPAVPNRLNRNFETWEPNRKWISDITYCATEEKKDCRHDSLSSFLGEAHIKKTIFYLSGKRIRYRVIREANLLASCSRSGEKFCFISSKVLSTSSFRGTTLEEIFREGAVGSGDDFPTITLMDVMGSPVCFDAARATDAPRIERTFAADGLSAFTRRTPLSTSSGRVFFASMGPTIISHFFRISGKASFSSAPLGRAIRKRAATDPGSPLLLFFLLIFTFPP